MYVMCNCIRKKVAQIFILRRTAANISCGNIQLRHIQHHNVATACFMQHLGCRGQPGLVLFAQRLVSLCNCIAHWLARALHHDNMCQIK